MDEQRRNYHDNFIREEDGPRFRWLHFQWIFNFITGQYHQLYVLWRASAFSTYVIVQGSILKRFVHWTTVFDCSKRHGMHQNWPKFVIDDRIVVGISWICVYMKTLSILSMEWDVKIIRSQFHSYKCYRSYRRQYICVTCFWWVTIWGSLLFDLWSQMMYWLLSKTLSYLPTPTLTLGWYLCLSDEPFGYVTMINKVI